ncbi:Unknown protein, partial [Striga hermonthica]
LNDSNSRALSRDELRVRVMRCVRCVLGSPACCYCAGDARGSRTSAARVRWMLLAYGSDGLDARWPSACGILSVISPEQHSQLPQCTHYISLSLGTCEAQNAAAVPAQNSVNVLAQFLGLQPATFNGQGDPRIVEEWIRSLEQLFEAMNCTEQERIQCAQLQMIGDAGLWWFLYWQMSTVEEKQALTWSGFKQIVKEKYYPAYYRAQMEWEFLDLEQEQRRVDEYEREFTRLAFFVPYLVGTDEKKARRFRDGLRDVIRNHFAGHGELSYVETISRAQQIDTSIKQKSRRVLKTTVNPPVQPLVQQMPNQQENAKNKRKWKARQDERKNRPRGQGQAGQQPQQ